MELDRRGCVVQPRPRANRRREEPVDKAKPFDIPKREVWEAFKPVKVWMGDRFELPAGGPADAVESDLSHGRENAVYRSGFGGRG